MLRCCVSSHSRTITIIVNTPILQKPVQPVSNCSQHVGEEIAFVELTAPFLPNTVLPLYEGSVFLPLKLTTNTRSRAPPVFSNELPDFA